MIAISPADQAVIGQALLSAAREMGATLWRSAFSPIVRDGKDASTGIMDATGAAVAQSDELIPILVGSLSVTLRSCMRETPPQSLREGDFYITNHPYRGAHHLSDILIFMPFFAEGRILGYVAAVAHHLDVGGGAPGLNSSATDLYGEGLVIPPMRCNLARDWEGEGNLRRMIAANIRVPDQTIGDIESQFAACAVGLARLHELNARYGTAMLEAAMAGQIAYVERRMRAAIAALPDGSWTAEDFVDDDGLSDAPLRVCATITVAGDRMVVDFDGTAPQVRSHLNAPYASVVSGVLAALKSFLTGADVPFNEGAANAVTITVPEGTLLNPRFPAPVRARMEATYRAHDAVVKALGLAVPERAVATGFDTTTSFCLTWLEGKRYHVFIELRDGGNGASVAGDGADAVAGALSNCTNVPVEAIDADYPYFRIEAYALLPRTGGAGRHRGGNGSVRRYRILRDGVRLAIYTDRFRVAASGLAGGEDGALGSCRVLRGDQVITVRSKDDVALQADDILEMRTGGGGGYGEPDARPDALQQADARLAAPAHGG
jgi:N-methylhydantoinase B